MEVSTSTEPVEPTPSVARTWWRRGLPDAAARPEDTGAEHASWWAVVLDWLADLDWDWDGDD